MPYHVRACFLCESNSKSNKDISFHQFPKNPNIRKKWKYACGYKKKKVSNLFLCSLHFTNIQKRVWPMTGKITLDPRAIPAVSVPNPPQELFANQPILLTSSKSSESDGNQCKFINNKKTIEPDLQIKIVDNIVSSASCLETNDIHTNDSNTSAYNSEPYPNNQVSCTSNYSDLFQYTKNIMKGSPTKINRDTDNNNDAFVSTIQVGKENDEHKNEKDMLLNTSDDTDNNIIRNEHAYSASRKRRFYEPRFPSEIQYEDFLHSPRKIRRMINMIIKTDKKKSEEINRLKKQIKYYKKKYEGFRSMITDLKKEKLIT
ncbi:uncharacterized protein LOC122849102 [Aphidius gifuensis]|uniref:uncharacterized protein LOC122849102 n=1 Tax=Aphidius gifuensis TaxID=684658 RepID=UPI001CDD5568|nr:uncharacterized protein LOC122849102 [Aphidius gifuensis]XP_044003639.1 uncharacterized protein LOC122849102 [Aphidius gifuensis]